MIIDNIRSFLTGLANNSAQEEEAASYSPEDPRLAAAALMYHVIQADGILRPVERERFESILQDEYQLSKPQLDQLIEAAVVADGEAVDLYRFTSTLMRHLQREQCVSFIELLWEMVYADGVRHELEDNVVWRVSELLGVSGPERIAMRQRVQQRYHVQPSTHQQ